MKNRYKKTRYQKKLFESTGISNDVSSNIYNSMLLSNAWQSLTTRQKLLYVYCKMQYYSEKNKPNSDQTQFTFNQAKWGDKYKLYTNKNQFYTDISGLIEKGFIICVECGANTRKKSIYQFTDKWHKFGDDNFIIPTNDLTYKMQRERLKNTNVASG